MAEYKNGFGAQGNLSVAPEDIAADVQTGRVVYIDTDKYTNDTDYKAKVDQCIAEGFYRVTLSNSPNSSNSSNSSNS